MSFLLDTHIWLWGLAEPERIPAGMLAALRGEHAKYISVVSIWEAVLLTEKGRIVPSRPLPDLVAEQASSHSFHFLGVDLEVAQEFSRVRLNHRDPADRLLVATARIHGLTLLTADRLLLASAGVPCWRG